MIQSDGQPARITPRDDRMPAITADPSRRLASEEPPRLRGEFCCSIEGCCDEACHYLDWVLCRGGECR